MTATMLGTTRAGLNAIKGEGGRRAHGFLRLWIGPGTIGSLYGIVHEGWQSSVCSLTIMLCWPVEECRRFLASGASVAGYSQAPSNLGS